MSLLQPWSACPRSSGRRSVIMAVLFRRHRSGSTVVNGEGDGPWARDLDGSRGSRAPSSAPGWGSAARPQGRTRWAGTGPPSWRWAAGGRGGRRPRWSGGDVARKPYEFVQPRLLVPSGRVNGRERRGEAQLEGAPWLGGDEVNGVDLEVREAEGRPLGVDRHHGTEDLDRPRPRGHRLREDREEGVGAASSNTACPAFSSVRTSVWLARRRVPRRGVGAGRVLPGQAHGEVAAAAREARELRAQRPTTDELAHDLLARRHLAEVEGPAGVSLRGDEQLLRDVGFARPMRCASSARGTSSTSVAVSSPRAERLAAAVLVAGRLAVGNPSITSRTRKPVEGASASSGPGRCPFRTRRTAAVVGVAYEGGGAGADSGALVRSTPPRISFTCSGERGLRTRSALPRQSRPQSSDSRVRTDPMGRGGDLRSPHRSVPATRRSTYFSRRPSSPRSSCQARASRSGDVRSPARRSGASAARGRRRPPRPSPSGGRGLRRHPARRGPGGRRPGAGGPRNPGARSGAPWPRASARGSEPRHS